MIRHDTERVKLKPLVQLAKAQAFNQDVSVFPPRENIYPTNYGKG